MCIIPNHTKRYCFTLTITAKSNNIVTWQSRSV
nr:MAG TPA_asm: hypothetical protein [Bacteriophage sp.]